MTCWGVYREQAHSPGRIDDDAAILESVGGVLTERGFRVELIAADALIESPSANVFVMCERGQSSIASRRWRKRGRSSSIRPPPFATPTAIG